MILVLLEVQNMVAVKEEIEMITSKKIFIFLVFFLLYNIKIECICFRSRSKY